MIDNGNVNGRLAGMIYNGCNQIRVMPTVIRLLINENMLHHINYVHFYMNEYLLIFRMAHSFGFLGGVNLSENDLNNFQKVHLAQIKQKYT